NARFQALGELPRDAARRVEQRFRDAERTYRLMLRQAQHDAVMRGVDRLYDIDIALSELEAALISGASAAEMPERIGAIDGLDVDRPGPFADRIKALMRGDAAALKTAASGTSTARHRLAIEMEIAAGLETPTEYQ